MFKAWTYITDLVYRDGLVLYTVTSDATLRIFTPVLDSPQHMQLHATLDMSSSTTSEPRPGPTDYAVPSVFYLDREIVNRALTSVLSDTTDKEDAKIRRVQDIRDAGWDMFMQALPDGSLSIQAVAASTLSIIGSFESHLWPEYGSATTNTPQAVHPPSKRRFPIFSSSLALARRPRPH